MRIAVGLLACLGAAALASALADPSTEAAPAATTTTAAPAAATPAPAANAPTATQTQVISAKAELDKDTAHFVSEGYKPEMRNGEQVYCRRENVLGSRVNAMKRCGTIEQLKLSEGAAVENVSDMQRRQTGTSMH